MTQCTEFSKFSKENQSLVLTLTSLTKPSKSNLSELFEIINFMNQHGASDKEIWLALIIHSNLIDKTDFRWYAVKQYVDPHNRDLDHIRRLLSSMSSDMKDQKISSSALFVFGSLVVLRMQYLLDHPPVINRDVLDDFHQTNHRLWKQLYEKYAPMMKRTPLWTEFELLFCRVLKTPQEEANESRQNDPILYLVDLNSAHPQASENLPDLKKLMNEAWRLGLLTAEFIHDRFVVTALNGEEELLSRWINKVMQQPETANRFLFFDHSKSGRWIPWRYKELDFNSVEFIRDRIQARCDVMAYKDEDIQNCHLMVQVKY